MRVRDNCVETLRHWRCSDVYRLHSRLIAVLAHTALFRVVWMRGSASLRCTYLHGFARGFLCVAALIYGHYFPRRACVSAFTGSTAGGSPPPHLARICALRLRSKRSSHLSWRAVALGCAPYPDHSFAADGSHALRFIFGTHAATSLAHAYTAVGTLCLHTHYRAGARSRRTAHSLLFSRVCDSRGPLPPRRAAPLVTTHQHAPLGFLSLAGHWRISSCRIVLTSPRACAVYSRYHYAVRSITYYLVESTARTRGFLVSYAPSLFTFRVALPDLCGSLRLHGVGKSARWNIWRFFSL